MSLYLKIKLYNVGHLIASNFISIYSLPEFSLTNRFKVIVFRQANDVSDAAVSNGSAIHYLDADNLDFSQCQHCTSTAPAVPPKPIHLRQITSTEVTEASDANSSGYNELDPRSTQAFFMVTKKVFEDTE